jgi:hypothetical protein
MYLIMGHDHDVNPIRSITMSAFTKELLQAASQSIALLPQVTTAAGLVISKGASATVHAIDMVDGAFAYGANEMDSILKRQKAESAALNLSLDAIVRVTDKLGKVDISAMSDTELDAYLEQCFEMQRNVNSKLNALDKANEG